ncbi:hypothetical protein CcaverHIS002_0701020 [Cutaneotrichosporon cavernicola]|uniref:Myb-like domain-containing protein n=1 Tax=Cutaneotrichosporon cavernicola TaxID=279322 RepID=A0AA48QYM1_9TREE|nr:uncharacterized protein CcaverHIS019_0701030 [Cutaneotrichosporon cavernicola]BEI86756.1 hypothetical protein CcaverHIS002_0701020 [Cutaneotrichosporon cavernicola]BEI94531.1 hypothetical protein CcaverHIS019_0701030 [Cutaneotrichosporon cavernicola]BEJ02307.1 hypothetical protein CcaverHIS631_0701020 [Cutaneotrichosporon cavernicola]BEJ10066.1 hypothetical protein CcaverHIS641_0701010 [Cutaneotrichosporon cavernicola]
MALRLPGARSFKPVRGKPRPRLSHPAPGGPAQPPAPPGAQSQPLPSTSKPSQPTISQSQPPRPRPVPKGKEPLFTSAEDDEPLLKSISDDLPPTVASADLPPSVAPVADFLPSVASVDLPPSVSSRPPTVAAVHEDPPSVGAAPPSGVVPSLDVDAQPASSIPEPSLATPSSSRAVTPSRSSTPLKRGGKSALLAAAASSSSPIIKHGKSRGRAPVRPAPRLGAAPSPAPELDDDDRSIRSATPGTRRVYPPKRPKHIVADADAPSPAVVDAPPVVALDGPASTAEAGSPAVLPVDDGPPAVGSADDAPPLVGSVADGPPAVGTVDVAHAVLAVVEDQPPAVAAINGGPPAVGAVHDAYPFVGIADDGPPAVGAILDDVPPVVGSASRSVSDLPSAVGAASTSTPSAAQLAAEAVASITPLQGPAQTLGALAGSRRRKRRAPSNSETQDSSAGDEADIDADDSEDVLPVPAPKKKRGRRKKATAEGAEESEADNSASTPNKKRKAKAPASGRPQPRAPPRIQNPELDGVEADDMVGEEKVNMEEMSLSQVASLSRGRVSARALKLHQFQRSEAERKAKERADKAEERWRKRRVIRRKAREIRNEKRSERRAAGSQDEVSDDSVNSASDNDDEPERLTPPSSPSYFGRVLRNAPVVFDAEQRARMQKETDEKAASSSRAARRRQDDDEDIEGLGLFGNNYDDDDDDPMDDLEDLGEDFQLEVEADEQPAGGEEGDGEFAGLTESQFTGGHFNEAGEWVEEGGDAGAVLQRRNEEERRRILAGTGDRVVEIVDNETQFINSATWGKKVSNDRWTAEETELFFSALRETGENYTLMKAYFPGRNVRQLRRKAQRENKSNPERMYDAVMNRKPMDYKYLAKSSGFNSTEPYDHEHKFLADLKEEQLRQAEEDRQAALAAKNAPQVAEFGDVGMEMDVEVDEDAYDGLEEWGEEDENAEFV